MSRFNKLRKFENLTFDELCQLEDNTVVAIVDDIPFTVYEMKKLSPGKYVTVDIIQAGISFDQKRSDLKSMVLPLLNQRLRHKNYLERVLEHRSEYYKDKICGMDIVIIPVMCWDHWTVEVFYPKTNTIVYYNSLNVLTPTNILEAHRAFFQRILSRDVKLVYADNYPKQLNSKDCGLYVVKYAQYCLLNKPLSNLTDVEVQELRTELIKNFRKLSFRPDFENHRNSNGTISEEVREDEVMQESTDDTSESTISTSTFESARLPNLLKRTSFNSDHTKSSLDYWPSLNNIYKTNEPFVGKTSRGFEKTYNTKGNFKLMLSVTEVLMHLAPENPKKGLELLEIEIKNDKEMAVSWTNKGRKPEEELNPYHFRWSGYFKKIQKWMWNFHNIRLKDNFKTKRCEKKRKFYTRFNTGTQKIIHSILLADCFKKILLNV